MSKDFGELGMEMLMMAIEKIKNIAGYIGHAAWTGFYTEFIAPDGTFFAAWVAVYVLVGFGVALSFRNSRKLSVVKTLDEAFPRKVYLAESAILDLKYVTFWNVLIYPLVGYTIYTEDFVRDKMKPLLAILAGHFSAHSGRPLGFSGLLLYSILVVVGSDFGFTFSHILSHRIPFLWNFHKVHHSPPKLNLFTSMRFHPFEIFFRGFFMGLGSAAVTALFALATGQVPKALEIFGAHAVTLFLLIPSLLRHSHTWVSYGPLEHILSSPAMHQIHHSLDANHLDKNFCIHFSFLDRLFGTLYIPKARERLKFGISPKEWGRRRYDTFFGSFFHPFVPEAWIKGPSNSKTRRNLTRQDSSRSRKAA